MCVLGLHTATFLSAAAPCLVLACVTSLVPQETETQLSSARSQIASLRAEAQVSSSALDAAHARTAATQREVDVVETRLKSTASDLAAANARNYDLATDLAKARRELAEVTVQLDNPVGASVRSRIASSTDRVRRASSPQRRADDGHREYAPALSPGSPPSSRHAPADTAAHAHSQSRAHSHTQHVQSHSHSQPRRGSSSAAPSSPVDLRSLQSELRDSADNLQVRGVLQGEAPLVAVCFSTRGPHVRLS